MQVPVDIVTIIHDSNSDIMITVTSTNGHTVDALLHVWASIFVDYGENQFQGYGISAITDSYCILVHVFQ